MTTKELIERMEQMEITAPLNTLSMLFTEVITHLKNLSAELEEERYRHDRYVDFELAEAEELAKLKEATKWIPVTERLPERGQEVIVYTGNILSPVVMDYQFWDKDFNTWMHVTHLMPLPEPPKDVNQ